MKEKVESAANAAISLAQTTIRDLKLYIHNNERNQNLLKFKENYTFVRIYVYGCR